MRRVLALVLALALGAPAHAQIYPGYGTPTLLGDGAAGAPAYSFASQPTLGMYISAGSVVLKTDTSSAGLSQGGLSLNSNSNVTLRNIASGGVGSLTISTTAGGSAPDIILSPAAAGVAKVAAGGSASFANLGGVLFLEANNVTQSAVSQNLHSYTVPASLMTVNGKTLRVTALFLSVNNANAKAIGFTVCGGSLTFNATASIAGALRATAYITRTAANTWTTSVTVEEGLASGTLTQAKLSGTYNSTPACTDASTNTIAASVNTAGATDTSSGFFMVELLN